MIRRQRTHTTSPASYAPAFADFHAWVLSLPWVVERPYCLAIPGVRSFAVDCEPLNRRQLWLITGLQGSANAADLSLAVIVPIEAAGEIEAAGWAHGRAPMPARHVLMETRGPATDAANIEALTLTAYISAMA